MANSRQSEKRARQNLSRYKLRHAQRSRIRTAIKSVRSAIDSNNQKEALDLFKTAQKVIDSSTSKKVIHKNAAARTKSRLSAAIKKLS